MVPAIKNFLRGRLDLESRVFVKNSGWVFLATAVSTLCVFLRSVILGRVLGADLYGTFILVTTFVIMVQEFLNLNIGTALVKFGADYRAAHEPGRLVAFLKLSFLITGITALLSVAVVAVVSYLTYGLFFKTPDLLKYMILYALGSSVSFFDFISLSLLRLFYRFRMNSLITIIMSVAELLIVAAVVIAYPKQLPLLILAVVAAMIFRGIVTNGIALWELRAELIPHRAARITTLRDERRPIWNFIVSNSISRTLKTMTSNGDVLILGALAGTVQVGLYAVAKKLAFSILRITDPLRTSIYPQLASLISGKRHAETKIFLGKVTRLLLIPNAVFFIMLLFLNRQFITLFYGPEFGQAGQPFIFLFIAAGLSSVFFWSLSIVLSLGMVNLRLAVNIVGLLAGAAVAFMLAPSYGAVGVAAALLVSEAIIQSVMIGASWKRLSGR